jgi:hypothetical protein
MPGDAGSGTARVTSLAEAQYGSAKVAAERRLTETSGSDETNPRKVVVVVVFSRVTVRLVVPSVAVNTIVRPGEKSPLTSDPKKLPPNPRTPEAKLDNVIASVSVSVDSQMSVPLPPERNRLLDRR